MGIGPVKALVVGGAGPTGPFIVEGLRARGYQVAVLNRGVHPVEAPDDVERITGDPHFLEPLSQAIGDRTFDLVIASYGRLAVVAEALAGRAGRFIGVGGFVAYRGFYDPKVNFPAGLPLPTPESFALIRDPAEHRFAALVTAAEDTVFRLHPGATIFRYPYVYGPRQLVPREWSIVRRVLDRRREIVVLDGGLSLMMHGYAENLAHAIMLAIERPEAAAGMAFNCGDEVQLDQRQLIEVAAAELGVSIDLVSVPDTPTTRAIALNAPSAPKLMDIALIRERLGYRDVVPTVEAVRRTVRYYADNPLERGGSIEQRMYDAFDYAAEDRLIALTRDHLARIADLPAPETQTAHPYAHPKQAGAALDQRGR
ncbi:NAD-dependent epimerase/dehydratase family protein [Sphingomonas crocodyli]|uniref:NAD-dependent epimerase/dehydratase family protein n=1 Tax=Sphingomonas crocodyli TaxID=1979270 RepID=A0A437LUV2_9SPHN|nr:NAD-dependent epimerase/dehydratase family protein [Sphingomonas crocodyli]